MLGGPGCGILAERLQLREVQANARITLAVARYLAGSASAYPELVEVTEHCRVERLTSRRRAVQNLAWALQEEGDLAGSARLVDEQLTLDLGGEHSLATSFADQWARAYYAGDWTAALAMAAESTRRPTAEWDLHIVAVSGWMRGLAGAALVGPAGPGLRGLDLRGLDLRGLDLRSWSELRAGRGSGRNGCGPGRAGPRRGPAQRIPPGAALHAGPRRALSGGPGPPGRGDGAADRVGRGLATDPDDPLRGVGAGRRARRRVLGADAARLVREMLDRAPG
ncbi:hypothetical protein NKG94_47220 [Micromonospora sp. M12]